MYVLLCSPHFSLIQYWRDKFCTTCCTQPQQMGHGMLFLFLISDGVFFIHVEVVLASLPLPSDMQQSIAIKTDQGLTVKMRPPSADVAPPLLAASDFSASGLVHASAVFRPAASSDMYSSRDSFIYSMLCSAVV
jgi:hypothetical protein